MNSDRIRPIIPEVAAEAAGLVRLGLLRVEPVAVTLSGAPLESEIETTCAALAAEHAGKSPSEIPGIEATRKLYRAFGVDPTRTRPSSEALLRRIIKGKPLPRLSNAVDLCNLAALRFLLSLGLYDTDAITEPVLLRCGREGESYPGIRKEQVNLHGRPTLTDAHGPFGNPTSDSLRTSVTARTRSLWYVIFAPAGYPRERLEEHVDWLAQAARRHLAPLGDVTGTHGLVLVPPGPQLGG